MGEQLIKQMLPALDKMPWPANDATTELGRKTYLVGVDKVDSFKGDPKALAAALRTFQTGDSKPYAFAGAAYTLLAASREQDGSYVLDGLDGAMHWLEKAQALEPDIVEINVIEALVYIYSGRYDDARLILDYLMAQEAENDFLLNAEIDYWQKQGNVEEAVKWYEKAIRSTSLVPHRLRLQAKLGDCFLEFGFLDRALEVYKEAVHFDKENPWLWHNISVIYWRQEDYTAAERCNKKALSLLDFTPARQMQEALKKKSDSGGVMGRLFGR